MEATMSISSEAKQYYHNKGEQDFSEGEYKPPTTPMNTLGGILMTQSAVERQQAYDKGYDNAGNQSGGSGK